LLKRKLRGQLNAARPAASKERVADSDIACRDDVVRAISYFTVSAFFETAPAALLIYIAGRVGNKRRKEWVGKIRMVQKVKKLRAQLKI
jgi:hypothetical protein